MGKVLILKDANFATNGIVRRQLAIDSTILMQNPTTTTSSGSGPWADDRYESLQGKRLLGIELKLDSTGVLTICKKTSGVISDVAIINVTSEMTGNIVFFPLDIIVGENDIIGIHKADDSGGFYWNHQQGHGFFNMDNGSTYPNKDLCINWYTD